jgi:hypothetical protein
MASLRVNVLAEPKKGSKLEARAPAVYDDPGMTATRETGAYETVDYDNVEDIVVWLEPANGSTIAGGGKVEVPVNADRAAGAIVPASVGQTILFKNAGGRVTGVYSVSDGNEFDLKGVAPGFTGSYVAKSPGLIEVLTGPSKEPAARVYVAPSRWVARARSGRIVDFADVPPGRYTVVAWHPRLPTGQAAVDLAADRASQVTVRIGVNALPKVFAR